MNPETNCTSCGGGDANPNPLDSCTRSFLGCDNPCAIVAQNTVACESLPSRVENFTKNFFGDVVRTEVNGQVVWSLPCGLDVGLPANPRGLDEGLACYFLRLFNDGIVGLTGAPGKDGPQGAPGHSAYTVTLAPFVTPAVGQSVTIRTLYNPAMLAGEYVLVDTSGWYVILSVDALGNMTVRLLASAQGAGYVASGRLVVPSGAPGQSIQGPKGDRGDRGPIGATGPQGIQGATGAAGPAGDNLLANNATINGVTGSDFNVSSATVYALVSFGGPQFHVVLPVQGTYYMAVSMGVEAAGATCGVSFRAFNLTDGLTLPGLAASVTLAANAEDTAAMFGTIVTTGVNKTIEIQAVASPASGASVIAAHSTLIYFQIA